MSILLGAIADDFTGATDLANTLVKEGMRTLQTIGVPDQKIDTNAIDAIVVALKSRTAPVENAVQESLNALEWLKLLGAKQYFFKYCSTFDSTEEGNIGAVADALLENLNSKLTIVCPALPSNARTVYKGHLFVGDVLLSESSMKDHPLTPMRESDLVRILGKQSTRKVGLIPHQTVVQGRTAIRKSLKHFRDLNITYSVVDALNDMDLRMIGNAVSDLELITGASGLAQGLPDNFRRKGWLEENLQPSFPRLPGGAAILAGSCSAATRQQLDYVSDKWPMYQIDPLEIAAGKDVIADLMQWSKAQKSDAPLVIFSSLAPESISAIQDRLGREKAAAIIENIFANIARNLTSEGCRKIIVAGGETSGAVVTALGVRALRIGPEIDPGVPWCETLDGNPIALALKSGNFGGPDFFVKSLELLQ